MRTRFLCSALLVLAACAKPEAKVATDTTTAAPMGAGATAPPIALADVAGKWAIQTMSATSDTVLVTSELNLTADGNGATLTFANRPPIPATVTASGDSIVSVVGPYESALRKGVMVTTTFTTRLVGSELVGSGVARYNVNGPDSALKIRMKGTRIP
jgi:hypothetical protein